MASAGIGVAILVMVPFTQWVITNFGWRVAYQVTAGTVLLLVVPVAFFVLRGRPEDFGLKKDGGAPAGTTGSGVPVERFRVVDREWVNRRWTVALALRTRRYWALLVMTVFTHIAIQTVLVHQVAYMVDGGYDSMLAASIVGLIGLVSIGAKIGSGWISDRLGREKSWTIALSCIAASIPPLLASRLPGMSMLIFLYAVVFAIGYGMVTPLTPAVTSDMFAGRAVGLHIRRGDDRERPGECHRGLDGGVHFRQHGELLPRLGDGRDGGHNQHGRRVGDGAREDSRRHGCATRMTPVMAMTSTSPSPETGRGSIGWGVDPAIGLAASL